MAARISSALAAFAGVAHAASATCAAAGPLSCHNTTAVDTCCFNYPGGHLLQTQFWDTDPATGPSDSWTIHGLWPDHCDGTYDSTCDSKRQYTNITQILQGFGDTSTLSYMQTYWKDYSGDDESFWEHEWGKHGTCISTLATSCYTNYQATQEVVDFFDKTVSLFKSLPSYEWLSDAGIVPSTTATYTLSQIQSALQGQFGVPVTINCKNGEFNELWYHYEVQGSVQSGTFKAATPVGSGSTCPSSGIKYLPKGSSGGSTTTATSATRTTTTATSTSTGAPSGKGYVNVISGASQTGCIISGGTWYTSGTCATMTATTSGSGFTLSSSKGKCAIASNALTCSSSVTTATVFTYAGGNIIYGSSKDFYADAVASGSTQQTVYTTSKAATIQLTWQQQ
ncbi:ribonuclease M [Venturia nashicola]|uniref:Ribonuclease T2-like n=1 Tax=Venturia nashicola TaxID=86259 RepID=A0A4Z1NZR8_9PEZI|nr:ribonuclease M [Venturia nashicola]TLD20113.1 ribonuclease M [Venturia nashicola]